ncbi:MAG: DUF2070 family protein [Candidatus Micrarchaeales archaeon]
MPNESFLLHYSSYFNKNAPKSTRGAAALFAIGIVAGIVATMILNYSELWRNFLNIAINGMNAGLLAITLPALISSALIKILKKRIYLKHILMAMIIGTISYSLFIIINSIVFAFLKSTIIAYIIILLANASLFGYWFIVSRFIMGRKRDAIAIGVIQPTLNFLFYIPISKYFISIALPFWPAVVKLYVGMFIFMVAGYAFFYVVDKPVKKRLNISGVEIFTVMVSQWLYNIGTLEVSLGIGKKTDIKVKLLALKGKAGMKSIFVEPDIHYGPFAGTGGASVTEYLGNFISKKYKATPFVLHGAVNVKLNPISTKEVITIGRELEKNIESLGGGSFKLAKGNIGFGEAKPCTAIAIRINGAKIITLTKAPKITEDIDHDVGEELSSVAGGNTIIIDAHNSRFESANKEELMGVYKGSRYVDLYKKAIKKALEASEDEKLEFGSSSFKLSNILKNAEDLGKGYSSVGIFKFGDKRFAMIYFDANNMLPSLRKRILEHVMERYGMKSEVYTTDTHSVNSLARPFTNVLGRKTSAKKLIPIIDIMIENALKDMESVSSAYKEFIIHDFAVWGEDAEKKIIEISKEIIRRLKYIVPLIVAAGFVIAAWLIYLV